MSIDIKAKEYMDHFKDIKDSVLLEIIESAFRDGFNGVSVNKYLNKFREIQHNSPVLFDVIESAVVQGCRERFSLQKQ